MKDHSILPPSHFASHPEALSKKKIHHNHELAEQCPRLQPLLPAARRPPLRLLCALIAAMAGPVFGTDVFAQEAGPIFTETRVLDRVFLVRDRPGTPTEFRMVVNAGSADEPGGRSQGLAHYLEHLILVGRNPENAASALRFFPDATSNGWTNQKATVYTHSIPARAQGPEEDLKKLFEFYSARLKDFSISEEEAARERNVVLQEYDWRYGANPTARFAQKIDEALLAPHPLAFSTAGTRASIMGLSLAEAQGFHARWYRSNNVWFLVKGDIDPEKLAAIAGAALDKLPAPPPVPEHPYLAPPDFTPQKVALRESDRLVSKELVFFSKLFRFEDTEPDAARTRAQVLSAILSTQLPGSLHEYLVDLRKVATGYPNFQLAPVSKGVYALEIAAEPAPDLAADTLSAAIDDYVASLASAAIADRTLTRIKRRFADRQETTRREASSVLSRLLGWLAAGHDYADLAQEQMRVQALRSEDFAPLLAAMAGQGRSVGAVLSPAEAAAP